MRLGLAFPVHLAYDILREIFPMLYYYVACLNFIFHVIFCYLTKSYCLFAQPVITTRIYALLKITIALKFMSYINSDLPIPAKKLQTPG